MLKGGCTSKFAEAVQLGSRQCAGRSTTAGSPKCRSSPPLHQGKFSLLRVASQRVPYDGRKPTRTA
eukprot:1031237-Alexandrium_andersonii.AAC.1